MITFKRMNEQLQIYDEASACRNLSCYRTPFDAGDNYYCMLMNRVSIAMCSINMAKVLLPVQSKWDNTNIPFETVQIDNLWVTPICRKNGVLRMMLKQAMSVVDTMSVPCTVRLEPGVVPFHDVTVTEDSIKVAAVLSDLGFVKFNGFTMLRLK